MEALNVTVYISLLLALMVMRVSISNNVSFRALHLFV